MVTLSVVIQNQRNKNFNFERTKNMDRSEIIIEDVKIYECVYNVASKDYENVQKKAEIWERIAGLANLSGDSCRKRWKVLRDTYKRRKRAAVLASGSGAPTPLQKWKYMESLIFLYIAKMEERQLRMWKEKPLIIFLIARCQQLTTQVRIKVHRTQKKPDHEEQKKTADGEVTSMFKEVMKECAESVWTLASADLNEGSKKIYHNPL